MIITHISGGLGNQMFQYAFGRYLAYKNNTELKLDITECIDAKDTHHGYYRLGEFNIQENFATAEEIKGLTHVREDPVGVFEEELFKNSPDNIFLDGYWFDERYSSPIRDILLNEFTLKHSLGKNSALWKEKILSDKCAVSLHLRCGDCLTPLIRNGLFNTIGLNYYQTCIKELTKRFGYIKLFVFSDDLDFAKTVLKFDVPTEFVEGCETDVEELYLMSICKHNINYGSTFSWWGAWLNQNPGQIYFRPEAEIKTSTPLIEFPPMLSVIVYVENNLSTINQSLSSVISQDFKDYEIILVDASTDGSSEICKKASKIKKLTLLTADSATSKFAAWNQGLEVALGDYVLFLTAKDFMLLKAVKTLAAFYYYYLENYLEPKGKYLSYANYDKIYPDIICTTQRIIENEHGTLDLELPGKKFSVKVDDILIDLNTFVETDFSAEEKLLAFGTKSINPYVATKFFKRQFLNENNIRFNETGGGMDEELTFIVESFLKTKKIVFISTPFIGRLK